MKTHARIKRWQHYMLGRVMIGSFIATAAVLLLFSGSPDSSAGSLPAETLTASKTTATPMGQEGTVVPSSPTDGSTLTIADCVLNPEEIPSDQLSTAAMPATLWKWQYGRHSMHAVHFNNTNEGWAVGDWGLIVHTTDGGQSWERQESGVGNWLGDVQFVDANTGWAVGSAGTILHTADGGLTWNIQSSPLAVDLYVLSFVDNQRGWIGHSGAVLKTTDGGNSWTNVGSGIPSQVRDMQFFDVNEGALICNSGNPSDGRILLTSDGGVTWTSITCTRPGSVFGCARNFQALHFPRRTFGVAVGGWVNPEIYITNDGGANWEQQETDITFSQPDSVYFIDENNGWAVGDYYGGVLRTSDGGQTWAKFESPWASAVQFVTINEGFVAGLKGVSLSTDSGYTWFWPSCFDDTKFYDVSFVNSDEGWVAGGKGHPDYTGKLLHTTDGGQTWKVQRVDSSGLNAVHFNNPLRGWAVGDNGRILTTANGGDTWTAQAAGTDYILHDVVFVDDSYGWIVGEEDISGWGDGRVWRTTDGGAHWTQSGHFEGWGDYSKHSVDFINRNIGYVAGAEEGKGGVRKSTDGGQTWIEKPFLGDYPILRNLSFINANEGWVVGDDGFIAHTNNGGDSWDLQASGTGDNLYAVSFLDSQRGYAVGGYYHPIVLKTTDSGLTWVEEVTSAYSWSGMRGIASPDPYHVWVAGDGSAIRSYTDPDIPPTPTPTSTPPWRLYLPLILKETP